MVTNLNLCGNVGNVLYLEQQSIFNPSGWMWKKKRKQYDGD